MKILKLLPVLGCVLLLTTASTCHSDDDNTPTNFNQHVNLVNSVAQQGDWRITYFFDSDQEETSNFNNFTFTFESGGVLTASNGTDTHTGAWSVTNSHNSNDDSPHQSSDIDFNILFNSPNNFAELSEDWDIVSYTSTKIELIHISGGNGGTDHLTFEKN